MLLKRSCCTRKGRTITYGRIQCQANSRPDQPIELCFLVQLALSLGNEFGNHGHPSAASSFYGWHKEQMLDSRPASATRAAASRVVPPVWSRGRDSPAIVFLHERYDSICFGKLISRMQCWLNGSVALSGGLTSRVAKVKLWCMAWAKGLRAL